MKLRKDFDNVKHRVSRFQCLSDRLHLRGAVVESALSSVLLISKIWRGESRKYNISDQEIVRVLSSFPSIVVKFKLILSILSGNQSWMDCQQNNSSSQSQPHNVGRGRGRGLCSEGTARANPSNNVGRPSQGFSRGRGRGIGRGRGKSSEAIPPQIGRTANANASIVCRLMLFEV
ncbi:hypothetical protein AB6A40_008940 [Gnathostoma spinigerum]|uniref:Uncharacterized protein n=1 Tax=Gnathostoma spinigerum TaxID=75299 RepID=A0ABD6ESC7_9BILA